MTLVLDFLKDAFPILKVHNQEFGNKRFSELKEDVQRAVLNYEFSVDLLIDVPDSEVYEIFARLNTYASTLNAQELRHAIHFGDFRSCVYALAQEFATFWEVNKIFTSKQILRMSEAEYISDLLIAMSEGIKAKEKRILDRFYNDNDENFLHRKTNEKRFRDTLDHIGGIMGNTLSESNLNSTRLFYPFFCAVYHMQYGLPKLSIGRMPLKPVAYAKLRNALQEVDVIIENSKEAEKSGKDSALSTEQRKFYEAFTTYWVHADKREILTKFICHLMLKSLKS